jgi:hypothetical protein
MLLKFLFNESFVINLVPCFVLKALDSQWRIFPTVCCELEFYCISSITFVWSWQIKLLCSFERLLLPILDRIKLYVSK